jgi:tetratricopeptide (TPR) repeat protein
MPRAVRAVVGRVIASLVMATVAEHAAPAAGAEDGRYLRGEVMVVGDRGERRPVKGVKVWLRETGDPQVSRDGGQFRLYVPPRLHAGSRITIEADKEGFRIWEPLEGEARVPDDLKGETIEIRLLPVGSKLFLTSAAIERLIADAASRSREQITKDSRAGQVDLGRYLREWATKYGLSLDDVKTEVDRWATEVENNRQGDLLTRSRAAFARREFDEAQRLSHDAAESALADLQGLERQAQAIADKKRAARDLAVNALKAEGDAAFTSLRFDAALAAYRRVIGIVNRQDDPIQWAGAWRDLARAERQLGIRVAGPALHEHLRRSREAAESALQVYTRQQHPQDWAATQNDLASVLDELGTRTAGQKGSELLGQAAEAYRLALQVRTPQQYPQDWAATQNGLGIVLAHLGTQTGGTKGVNLLDEAVETFRSAVRAYPREQLPEDWAMTQNNLGNSLAELGLRTNEQKAIELLGQAAEAYRLALQVYTRKQLPEDWAMTQNNLGNVLVELGLRTDGQKGIELLGQAAEAYRLALQVNTREHLPQSWARTQNNLGTALKNMGTRTAGPKGIELLGQAAEAYRLALQVNTREQLPQSWAGVQHNLGNVLKALGTRTDGQKGIELLGQAAEAYRSSLQVRTREQFPQDWAGTQSNLGTALEDLGMRTVGPKGIELLGQAAEAYRLALQVYTPDVVPGQWAKAHAGLARASMARGDFSQAAESAARALGYFPEDRELMLMAGRVYRDRLFAFGEAYTIFARWAEQHPDDVEVRVDLAEASVTSGRTAEALGHLRGLLAIKDLPPSARVPIAALEVVARARGDDRTALATSVRMLANAVTRLKTADNEALEAPLWSCQATIHAVETSPAFASNRTWLVPLLRTFEGTDVSKIDKEVETALAKLEK